MDRKFLDEMRASDEMKFLARHVRQVADLERLDPRRMGVMSEAMQFWIAVAAAAGSEGGPDAGCDRLVIEIAQRGGGATQDAMRNGGTAPALACADAIGEFTGQGAAR